MKPYLDSLRSSYEERRSLICFGIDPKIDALPKKYREYGIGGVTMFLEREVFPKMLERKVFPGAFKLNVGFFLQYDQPHKFNWAGSIALVNTINIIRTFFPGIKIIGDWKLGDIGLSSENYARIYFDNWEFGAGTVSPWMGTDSVEPFLKYFTKGRGVYVLNRTSNPGAKDFQIELNNNQIQHPYMRVAGKVIEWARQYPGTGVVIGATALQELEELTNFYNSSGVDIPFLIPGVGKKQGGRAEDVVGVLHNCGYPLPLARINVSSGLLYPWVAEGKSMPENPADVVVDTLEEYNTVIGGIAKS